MCGICGYNGKKPSLDLIVKVLEKLEPFVGGKGTGIAFRLNDQICILKCKGTLQDFRENFGQNERLVELRKLGYLGIAHTRHPSSSFFLNEDRFSHPLHDCSKTLALVHNGTLDANRFYRNYKRIFDGHNFVTKKQGKILDSELLVHMIEHFHTESNSLLEAIRKTFSIAKSYRKLKGFGMFAVISNKEEKIYIAYGHHDENSLGIKRNKDGFYFYTMNYRLKKDKIETGEEISGWNPGNRDQVIVIEKNSVIFHKTKK